MSDIDPFTISISDEQINDLKNRIAPYSLARRGNHHRLESGCTPGLCEGTGSILGRAIRPSAIGQPVKRLQ